MAETALIPVTPRTASTRELQDWGVTQALAPQEAAKTPSRGAKIEVLPPLAFKGLKTGPEFGVEYEPAEAIPISASSELLRNLSPFTIQVEPPLVFGNNPPNPESAPKRTRVRVFEASAAASGNSYGYARTQVASAPYTSVGYGGSIEEVIARNSAGVQNQGPADNGRRNQSKDGRLGEPAIVDLQVAVDIAMQLSAMIGTPPLILLINPQSLQTTFTKIQQFTDRSRHGYIFQAWGEDQPKLAISARIGAYISGGRGVQFASRRDSASYQNLMSVLHFYKSNGYIHDTVGRSNAHHHVGALSIRYDQWVYYGHMQSFSFSMEDTANNGGLTFEMQFVVSALLDTSQTTTAVQPMRSPMPSMSDPRYRGADNRAFNEPGALYVNRQGSADRFIGGFTGVPPLVAQGVVSGSRGASGRVTAQTSNRGGFQASVAAPTPQPRQAPVGSKPGQVVPFHIARTGVGGL